MTSTMKGAILEHAQVTREVHVTTERNVKPPSPVESKRFASTSWLTQHHLNQLALLLFVISLVLAAIGTRGLTTREIISLFN